MRSVSIIAMFWKKIKDFVDQNWKDKFILATGDAKQLVPIKALTNTKKHEVYMNECIDTIFPQYIYIYTLKNVKGLVKRIGINSRISLMPYLNAELI